MKRSLLPVWALAALGLATAQPAPAEDDPTALRLDEPVTAIINARAADQTTVEWQAPDDALYFDAVHRSLLLRFPGAAERIAHRVRKGQRVASATLTLTWVDQELRRTRGYRGRGWAIPGIDDEDEPVDPGWHARAWLLKKPWDDHYAWGATWDEAIEGAMPWDEPGALAKGKDRGEEPVAIARIGESHRRAELDITELFETDDLAGILRQLSDRGLLIDRKELVNREFGTRAQSTGANRIFIENPTLETAFTEGEPERIDLPPAPDVAELAHRGYPYGERPPGSHELPENWRELSNDLWQQPDDMPSWMWEHVLELRDFETERRDDPRRRQYRDYGSGDEQVIRELIDAMLEEPPAWYMGHRTLDLFIPALHPVIGAMLPEIAHQHTRAHAAARWQRPHDLESLSHRVAIGGGMATLNHQSNFRSEIILAGDLLDDPELIELGERGLSLLNRQRIFSYGTSSEHGDSYYRGISIAALQSVAQLADDPLTRLKAQLAVEKLLLEDLATFHPNLRNRVSRFSRRYNRDGGILILNDAPEAIFHTLSPHGALMFPPEDDRPWPEDVPMENFVSTGIERFALLAPWGEAMDTHMLDDKPLPWRAVFGTTSRGRVPEQLFSMSYLTEHFGLASSNAWHRHTPVLGMWKRTDALERVEHPGDLAALLVMTRMNEARPFPPAPEDQGRMAAVQDGGRMLYLMSPLEPDFITGMMVEGEEDLADLATLESQVAVISWGETGERVFRINGEPVNEFPVTAEAGDRITMRDGPVYLGLIPLPASDLGRGDAVVIEEDYPFLKFRSLLRDSDEPFDTEGQLEALTRASAGWVVELAANDEFDDLDAFARHFDDVQWDSTWDDDAGIRAAEARFNGDQLELAVRPGYQRNRHTDAIRRSEWIASQSINGDWPWPEEQTTLDNPYATMGSAAELRKGGATLSTAEGQMALLRVDPHEEAYVGINPFLDPTPFELAMPDGAHIRADGPLGCGRIHAWPSENRLAIDYHIPPPWGRPGVEALQQHAQEDAPHYAIFFQEGVDVREAHETSARYLLYRGEDGAQQPEDDPPEVVLNGEPLEMAITQIERDGARWWRIPIVRPHCATPELTEAVGARSLLVNGTFDRDVEFWSGRYQPRHNGDAQSRPAFIARETDDLPDGSRGALRLHFSDLGEHAPLRHRTGAVGELRERAPADSRLVIRFDAKHIDGSPYLALDRVHGGADLEHVLELTDEWASYEVSLKLEHAASSIIWSLVEGPSGSASQRVVDGTVLLDNIQVSRAADE